MAIEKIKLGKKSKRAFFNMSHQVNTTLSFGFCEPTMCLDVIPDTKLDVQAYTGVRLAPLPQPTTGKIKLKQFYSYVKTKEVFEAFENLQSQTSVASSRGSYIPQTADNVQNFRLFLALLISQSQRLDDIIANGEQITTRDLAGQFFRLSFNSTLDIYGGSKTKVHNIWEDVQRAYSSETAASAERTLRAFGMTVKSNIAYIARQFATKFGLTSTWNRYGDWINWISFANYDADLAGYYNTNALSFDPTGDVGATNSVYVDFLKQFAPADTYVFSKENSFDNADFYIALPQPMDISMYQQNDDEDDGVSERTDTDICNYIGVHLTPAGRRLFKIFNAIGLNFRYSENVELPKLYAYYKSWFDIFNPGRNIQWKDTNTYKLIHSFYDSPSYNQSNWYTYLATGNTSLDASSGYMTACNEFYVDLAQCFYTEKVDPITVATETPVLFTNDGSDHGGSNTLGGIRTYENYDSEENSISAGYGQNIDSQGGLNIRFLQSLYNWVNKNTVIGQRVAQYMAEHFGVRIPQTSFIDKDSFDIDIFDSIATVNNEETALGEYAGVGKGRATGQSHKFEAPEHGYFFQFTVVVPVGGYSQTSVPAKVRRFDWFQPQFDSVGMEPISQSEVFGRTSFFDGNTTNNTFGFRPRYFNFKYKMNLANGGFSFRSERGKFLGYSLDRLFSEPELYRNEGDLIEEHESRENLKLMTYDGVVLRPDEELRYIGKDESFGNYDRIFYDTTGHTDNFIAYIDNNVKMFAPMKPISDSFEAFDETQDTDSVDVSHS